jgi:hypothetical protein
MPSCFAYYHADDEEEAVGHYNLRKPGAIGKGYKAVPLCAGCVRDAATLGYTVTVGS